MQGIITARKKEVEIRDEAFVEACVQLRLPNREPRHAFKIRIVRHYMILSVLPFNNIVFILNHYSVSSLYHLDELAKFISCK